MPWAVCCARQAVWVSLLWLCALVLQTVWLKHQKLISHSSQGWECQAQRLSKVEFYSGGHFRSACRWLSCHHVLTWPSWVHWENGEGESILHHCPLLFQKAGALFIRPHLVTAFTSGYLLVNPVYLQIQSLWGGGVAGVSTYEFWVDTLQSRTGR